MSVSNGSSTCAEAVFCRCSPEPPASPRFGDYHVYHRHCQHCGGVVPLGDFMELLLETERRSGVPDAHPSV